jgi:hypothetical protein
LDITCPDDFTATVECLAPAAVTDSTGLAGLGVVFNEQCGKIVISHNDVSDNNQCPETITRTYYILDDLNNNGTKDAGEEEVSCTQTITINDVTNPSLTVPTTELELGCNPQTMPSEESVVEASSATDNCTASPLITAVAGTITGTCAKEQTFTVTATDDCGNETEETVTYTWTVDTELPVITVQPT